MAEVVETHLSKILKREVVREGPAEIAAWWEDVDGRGTTIDQWMAETIAPLLLVLGQLDVVLDHPAAPEGADVISMADYDRFGLGKVVASYILPENMVWWTLDARGRYVECLVREVQDDYGVMWRYWDRKGWARYDQQGKRVGKVTPHPFGAVPIVRLFDRRRPRCKNVGLPRYEVIAEIQREAYNRASELVLSDTTHAHPLIQMAEDYCNPDATIPIGPNWVLPMKKNVGQGGATYQGAEVLEFPHAGADSIRTNLYDLRDQADRQAGLTKPAGAAGTDGGTVAQSGISKRLDASTGNDLLGKISAMLGRNEAVIADLFWLVYGDGTPDEAKREATEIAWPTQFDLASAGELVDLAQKLQFVLNAAGRAPLVEGALIDRIVKDALAGLSDEEYAAMAAEIEQAIGQRATEMEENRDMMVEAQQAQAGGSVGGGESDTYDEAVG